MSYTYKLIEDIYVVWFAPANRFMQLQEPAFRILQDWTCKLSESQIIMNCSNEFKLSLCEARRFVIEVIGQLQWLTNNYKHDKIISLCVEAEPFCKFEWFTTKYYLINGISFRFRFSDLELEELINPGFDYLGKRLIESEADHTFDLYHRCDQTYLQTDGSITWKCPNSKTDCFIGLVNMQMMNCIHNLTDADWMGAVHASAVSAPKGAILFTAPSGSGKSTFAAILMKQGYQVMSDDFLPVSLNDGKVYPFSEGISVKNGSLKVLQTYFPTLAKKGTALSSPVEEVFLPLTNREISIPATITAIVFLQYNPTVEVELQEISSLKAMERFLQQLWLLPTKEVAVKFMDWYFNMPCYTLQYSNSKKAIDRISTLFK